MFTVNEDMSILCTRGDCCHFPVTAMIDGEAYSFQIGDVVRCKIFRKKDCESVVLQRDFMVEAPSDSVEITLSGDDTKFGGVINKPTDFWYEIELNPDTEPHTIRGYDENGPLIFRLYPEGKDVDGEDIEVVGKKTLQELVDYALEHTNAAAAAAAKAAAVSAEEAAADRASAQTAATFAGNARDKAEAAREAEHAAAQITATSASEADADRASAGQILNRCREVEVDCEEYADDAKTAAEEARQAAERAEQSGGVVVSTPTYDFAVTDKDGKAAISVGKDESNQTFVDFVGKDEAVTVYNVTFNHPLASGFYTLATAIAAVPTKLRKPGLIVTFRSGATKWDSYQYTVAMTNNSYWNNLSYWQNNSQISTPEADEESGLKWCAMGDSITEGWYSYYNADGNATSQPNAAKGWASQVAALKGYELTNKAIGGTGFVRPNGTPAVNGKDVADATNFADYDFVTIAYGVNDWKYNCALGSMDDDVNTGDSIYSNMRYIIEKILTDNPLCKIIVITPINCCVQGAYDTNWGLGYAYPNNGTLEQIFDALVEVCEWYGIEYIDMTHNSVVNRQNIEQLLIDKVHPSEDCHKVMALELAKKIMF